MNALEKHLANLIRAQGPLSLSHFMAEALGHPQYGYYTSQTPFGRKGDFITAPEISQMFGEMIGLWQANNWLNLGSPAKIHLAELGPGRGTLMQDALRAMKIVPGLLDAVELHLVEISPKLRLEQQEKLKDLKQPHKIQPQWHDQVSDLLQATQDAPLLLIANEFFDALPIRQFEKGPDGWHERLVGLEGDDNLSLCLAPIPCDISLIPEALHSADPGSIAEICPVGENIVAELSRHIIRHGGVALLIDYGHDRYGSGDTLQAMKDHKFCPILDHVGKADLTAHVNFQALKETAHKNGAKTYGPAHQGDFLNAVGIGARTEALLKVVQDEQKEDIISAYKRLTEAEQMGRLFKAMALSHPNLTGIIGFGA